MAPSPISRRGFLIGGLSTVVLAGCSAPPRASRTPSETIPAAPSPSGAPSPSRAPIPLDVRELIGRPRFYVGHRGSGDNWPEHTLAAYRNSLQAGAEAVEISVCSTSDGVLICHHDLSGARVLGVDRKIADMTWSEVSARSVDARSWLGVNTPLEPVSRLEDVLRELDPNTLVFIEDKQGTNTTSPPGHPRCSAQGDAALRLETVGAGVTSACCERTRLLRVGVLRRGAARPPG